MGAHSSTSRHRSTATDTLTNMISSIGELNRWDNDATNVRSAVTQSITDIIKCQSLVTSPTPHAATPLSFFKSQPQSPRAAAASAADEMFDLSGARRVLREIERLFDGGRGGSIAEAAAFPTTPSAAGTSTPHSYPEYSPPPSLYPLIAPASKLFTQVALLHAALHKDSPPVASRSGSRVGDSPSGSRGESGGGESSTETLIENENDQVNALRLSIAGKWSFIRHLLNKTAKSARFSYQLKTRIDLLNKHLKPKRFDRLSHVEQLKLRSDYDDANELLNKSLLAYDQKRAAIPWLYQDYYLTLAVYQVDQLMQAVSMAKQSYKQESTDPMALNEFDQLLYDCESRRRQLDIAFQHNERQSLSLGLLYIDKDGKGYIEPSQAADLTAKLWATIDTSHHNQINADDLQKAIQSLSDQLEHLHNECRQIEAENAFIRRAFSQVGQLQLTQNERRLSDLNRRRDEIRQSLTGIYSFFHRAFGRLVFGVTEDQLPNHPRVEPADLLHAIDKVIHHNKIDPLIESEQKFFAKIRAARSPSLSSTSPKKEKAAKSTRHHSPGNGNGHGNGNGTRTAFLGLGIDYDRLRRPTVTSTSTQSASTPKSSPKFTKSHSSPPLSADSKQHTAPSTTRQYPSKDVDSSSHHGGRQQSTYFRSETPPQSQCPSSEELHRTSEEAEGVVFHKDTASQHSYEPIKRDQPVHAEETSKSLPPLDLNKDAAAEGASQQSSWSKETYSPGHPPRQSPAEFEKNVLLTTPPQPQPQPQPQPPSTSTTPKTKKSFSLSSLFQALSQSSASNQSSDAATSTTSAPLQSQTHEVPCSQLAIPVTTETVPSPTRPRVTHRYV